MDAFFSLHAKKLAQLDRIERQTDLPKGQSRRDVREELIPSKQHTAEAVPTLPLPCPSKGSSTWNLLNFVSTQDSEIASNFTPLKFCFNFFRKNGLFSTRQASFK